jgi:hypothetical protein
MGCAQPTAAALVEFLIPWHHCSGMLFEMQIEKFRWRRLAAALGIALGVEALELFVIIFLPPKWADVIGDLPLEPASYLVTLLAKAEPSGFEGQVSFFFLAVLLQWFTYSAIVYSCWRSLGRSQGQVLGTRGPPSGNPLPARPVDATPKR